MGEPKVMNLSNGSSDDGVVTLDPFDFDFYWFSVNYRESSDNRKIYFTTNSILSFGEIDFLRFNSWIGTSFNGIHIGTRDRSYNSGTQYDPTYLNGYAIKKFTVNLGNYPNIGPDGIALEIRLIRNTISGNQYIEIKVVYIDDPTIVGIWNLTDGSIYQNTFSGFIDPITGTIYVLRSNEFGVNWRLDPTTNIDLLLSQPQTPISSTLNIEVSQDSGFIQPTSIILPVKYERPVYTAKPSKSNFPQM